MFSLSYLGRQETTQTCRISFFDGPIVLLPPVTFTDLESWITIDLATYERKKDFEYTLSYMENTESIEVVMELKTTIQTTILIAKVKELSTLLVLKS
jgi:CRISPR/Cas system CMR subunit Cmr4 (Cas7 group RAMP superfamily)